MTAFSFLSFPRRRESRGFIFGGHLTCCTGSPMSAARKVVPVITHVACSSGMTVFLVVTPEEVGIQEKALRHPVSRPEHIAKFVLLQDGVGGPGWWQALQAAFIDGLPLSNEMPIQRVNLRPRLGRTHVLEPDAVADRQPGVGFVFAFGGDVQHNAGLALTKVGLST